MARSFYQVSICEDVEGVALTGLLSLHTAQSHSQDDLDTRLGLYQYIVTQLYAESLFVSYHTLNTLQYSYFNKYIIIFHFRVHIGM